MVFLCRESGDSWNGSIPFCGNGLPGVKRQKPTNTCERTRKKRREDGSNEQEDIGRDGTE